MINQLENLIELAAEWRDFSKNYNGLSTEQYPFNDTETHYARVYFGSDTYACVNIVTEWGKFEVNFFQTPEFTLDLESARNITEIIQVSRAELQKLIDDYQQYTQEELDQIRQHKIDRLKSQLKALEGTSSY